VSSSFVINTSGKLIEKAISNRLQVYSIASNFIHPNQLEGIKQYSTTDASIFLTYLIPVRWVKGLHKSILVFDITQFFPFLNHQLLLMILDKASFDLKISQFFSSHLINRQTQYVWDHFTSLFFRADISIGQESTLSPILLALYIVSIFYIFKKWSKNLLTSISVSILLFVDNSLFISQEKSYGKSNANIFCSYSIISLLFNQFSLVIEHDKWEVFHFLRSTKNINPPLLDLKLTRDALLRPKDIWQYLRFFFDKNSLFNNIFAITPIKPYLSSKTWRCWAIQQENSI